MFHVSAVEVQPSLASVCSYLSANIIPWVVLFLSGAFNGSQLISNRLRRHPVLHREDVRIVLVWTANETLECAQSFPKTFVFSAHLTFFCQNQPGPEGKGLRLKFLLYLQEDQIPDGLTTPFFFLKPFVIQCYFKPTDPLVSLLHQ